MNFIRVPLIDLELAIDPLPKGGGGVVVYDFLKLHYISHKMKYACPLRVAALTCKQYDRDKS